MFTALRSTLVLCILTFGFAASATSMSSSTDWAGFRALVGASTSLTEMVGGLPPDYLGYNAHTFVHSSLSPERDEISLETPRAILFGRTPGAGRTGHGGTVIIAYSPAKAPKLDQAQVIRDRGDGSFEFSEAVFDSGRGRLVPETDSKCARCHAGHPIWGSYRRWTGTFGPRSDLQWLDEDVEDYFKFQAFLAGAGRSALYSRLQIAGDGSRTKSSRDDFHPRQPYVPGAGFLLEALVQPNARFVAAKFRRSAVWRSLKYEIAAAFLGCSVLAPIDRELEALFPGELRPNVNEFSVRTKRLELIGRAMGVSPSDWTTEFETQRTTASDETVGSSLGSGVTVADFVFRELVRSIDDAEVQAMFTSKRWSDPYYSYLDLTYHSRIPAEYPRGFAAECALLGARMTSPTVTFLRAEVVPLQTAALKVQCTSCHNGSTAAPVIPFSGNLRGWISERDSRFGAGAGERLLRDKITSGAMPLDRVLSAAQRTALLNELYSTSMP